MSIDKSLEQFLATQTRIADALEAIAATANNTTASGAVLAIDTAPPATKPTTAKDAIADAKARAAADKKAQEEAARVAKDLEEQEAAEQAALLDGGGAAEEEKVLDFQKDIGPAFLAFTKAQGRDAAVELLGKFGAKNAAGVKKEDYAKFYAALTA
jgi:hypothetical protein